VFLISIISFAGSIAVALVQFPVGYLEDKNGRRWLLIIKSFILLATSALYHYLSVFWRVYEPIV
jgi:MFS family permease